MTDERDKLFVKLREPFPPEHIGKLPKPIKKDAQKGKCLPQKEGGQAPAWQDYCCGGYHGLPAVHLDFVGHAAVTSRLLEVDPEWTWEPKAGWDDNGEPKFVRSPKGDPIRLWITLTVLGVTRPGVGTVEPGTRDPEKQLIGDALRNAAMRFGVALDLWIKGQEEEHTDTKAEETKPEDPDQWFRDNGWADGKVAHDAYRTESIAIRNGLTDDQREEFRLWAQGEGVAFNRENTRSEAEAMRKVLEELRDEADSEDLALMRDGADGAGMATYPDGVPYPDGEEPF